MVVGACPRAYMVDDATETAPVVPVDVEVGDGVFWDDGVDPCQHGLLGGDAFSCDLYLVGLDEGPYQAQDELKVATMDIFRTCR